MGSEAAKTLFAFDFDHTLVDDNTDTFIMSLCPELGLTANLSAKRAEFGGGWTKFMDHTFSLIHGQGCTKEQIIQHMGKMRLHEQALQAIHAIHECEGADAVIVSDSNTVFIDTILEGCNVKHVFSSVSTNPSHFSENGRLHVRAFHSHDCVKCQRSTPNLCKGQVVQQELSGRGYDRVVYVGDGRNDYCPCLRLTEKDVVICREGYALAELLKHSTDCRAKVHTLDFISSLGDFIASNLLWT